MLMGDQRDLRMMTVYSYTRLVVFDDKLHLVPDILQSLDNQDDKVFTLHLREGHKWSDGEPFTAEDFRYYWDDVANNAKLSPSGPNLALLAAGKPPKFEVLDPLTVRYSWDQPNPGFVAAIAAAQPIFIFMPAHYLKQFNATYADKDGTGQVGQGRQSAELGRVARAEIPPVPSGKPRSADARPVGQSRRRHRPNCSASTATRISTASTRRGTNCPISTMRR